MVLLECSQHERCLRKLERFVLALVRTRPPKEPTESRKCNRWIEKCKGLAGPFALTLLVTIPYVAENTSGPIIAASLLLAAVSTCFAVWCYNDFECNHGQCNGDIFTCVFTHVGEFPAFLVGWWRIQVFFSAFAASARALSSIIDSVTGRHVETFMEETFGSYTPLGAPMDVMAVGITFVPSVMCAVGMEDSNFIRGALFALAGLASIIIFGSALATTNLLLGANSSVAAIATDRNLYSKILSGAGLASTGFLGIHKICQPDPLSQSQYQNSHSTKRFSLAGCFIGCTAFLIYFVESTVLNKVQPTVSIWIGDPPLLWPLEGKWRLGVASLGIAALALATFEFLIPLCIYVTKVANDGLLYRNLRKHATKEDSEWNLITPLFFGGITALHALLLDTKVLLGAMASGMLCIHIIVAASMLIGRYLPRPPHASRKTYLSRTRRMRGANHGNQNTVQARRMMTVSFLKSGTSKHPQEMVNQLDSARASTSTDRTNDRTFLMDDVAIAPIESRDSTDYSLGSGVSGYESEIEPDPPEETNETDVDAAVTEYQEHIRAATLNGHLAMNPTYATASRVLLSTMALIPCCIALASSLNRTPKGHLIEILLAMSSSLLIFLLLVVISRQPQRKALRGHSRTSNRSGGLNFSGSHSTAVKHFFQYSLVPWIPALTILGHSCLLIEILVDLAGSPFAFWFAIGLIVYFSYGVSKSIAAPPPPFLNESVKIRGCDREEQQLEEIKTSVNEVSVGNADE